MTQDLLKQILDYNPNSGEFRWKIKKGRVKPRDIAGCLDSWAKGGYVKIRFENKLYYAHRLAWLYVTGSWPKEQIDHINNVRSDNRFCNLREANNQQNNRNTRTRKNNTSGYKGVCFYRPMQKWHAQITDNGTSRHLGYFETAEEAGAVYQNAARELFEEFYLE